MKGLFQCPPWARSFCPFRAYCCLLLYLGCCPGLGAFALSGRMGLGTSALYLSLRPVTVGSGRMGLEQFVGNACGDDAGVAAGSLAGTGFLLVDMREAVLEVIPDGAI